MSNGQCDNNQSPSSKAAKGNTRSPDWTPTIGKWYWVRFRNAADKTWHIGHIRITGGIMWVARVYNTAHYGPDYFEFGREVKPPK